MSLRGRLLFLELLGGLGDVVIALPAIRALARSHPEADVEVLTLRPGDELLRGDPEVARVHVPAAGERAIDAAARLLAAGPWAAVVSDATYEGLDALVAGADVPVRVANLWRRPPDDELIERRFVRLLHRDGLVEAEHLDLAPQVRVAPEARAAAAAWWGSARPRVVLVPEAGMAIKRWPPARFAALARALAGTHGARCATLTGPEPIGVEGVPATPPGPLAAMAGLLAEADLCVAADTGPGRVAAAVGTPTLALFGPTWAGRFGLRAPHLNVQSPLPCPVRDPQDMTEQRCWWSGRCVYAGRSGCVEEIDVATVAALAGGLLRSRRGPV